MISGCFAGLAVIWDPNREHRNMHLSYGFVKCCEYQPMVSVNVSAYLSRGHYHLLDIQNLGPLFQPALRLSVLEEMARGRSDRLSQLVMSFACNLGAMDLDRILVIGLVSLLDWGCPILSEWSGI